MKNSVALITAFSVLILFSTYFSVGVSAGSSEPMTLYPYDLRLGDADDNGTIDISDVQEIQRYIALLRNETPNDIPAEWYDALLDINRNGIVSVFDVTVLQRCLADIEAEETEIGNVIYTWQQRVLQTTDKTEFGKTTDFNAVNPAVSSYLADPDPDVTNYSVGENLDKPAAFTPEIPNGAEKLYVIDTVTKGGYFRQVGIRNHSIQNLIPNRVCKYFFTDKENRLLKAGQCRATGSLRMINAGGNTFNIRDVGGWQCDGGNLKYGMIYRGCELNGDTYKIRLTEEQKRFFTDELGILDEIDLRSDSEVDGADNEFGTADDITGSALGDHIGYARFQAAPYAAGINLSNPYQTNYYSRIIKRIANDAANGKPCYIHCLVGADRTGTACALIEAICGVSQSDIEKDYELTSFAFGNTRVRTSAEWQGLIGYLNTMNGNSLRDKAVSYATKAGVTKREINLLRKAMIDGDPEII